MKYAGSRERARAAAASKKNDTESMLWDEEEFRTGSSNSSTAGSDVAEEVTRSTVRYWLRVCQYFFLSVLIILTFSYGFERHLRVSLVNQYVQELERASEAIFAEKQKSSLEAEEEEENSHPDQPCPVCGSQSPLLSAVASSASADGGSMNGKLTVQDVLDSWRTRNEILVESLTTMSRELLRVKYGAPPYYARFDLEFPSSSPQDRTDKTKPFFLMQLDGAAMPYTSLYFLEQVAAGAWDSCQFIVNAGVLLQVDTRGDSCSRAAFKKIKSVGESLAFQEYVPKLATGDAHKRLTVGLSGRPAGPIFYISLINNQANLGPRKSSSDEGMGAFGLPPQADPCFAKVVRGEDSIERINRLPVRDGDTQIRMLQEFVTITRAMVVPSEEALRLIAQCNPETTIC